MRLFGITVLSATLVVIGLVSAATLSASGNPHGDKVTICHASGLAGTTKFETLTIGHQAVYGPGGHFNENGTPQAGHEQDYFGPCMTDTTTTPTGTTPTDTTPTDTTPTDTTPTTPTETTPTTTTPGMRCPPGQGPFAGKDGQ